MPVQRVRQHAGGASLNEKSFVFWPEAKGGADASFSPIKNQASWCSGHLGEAYEWIFSAVIQVTNSTAVVSLFVDLQIGP